MLFPLDLETFSNFTTGEGEEEAEDDSTSGTFPIHETIFEREEQRKKKGKRMLEKKSKKIKE